MALASTSVVASPATAMAADRRRLADLALGGDEGEFVGRRLAVDKRELDVAAQQRLALLVEPALDGGRQRADDGDGGGAERQAGEKDPEALEARAQVTQAQSAATAMVSRMRPGNDLAVAHFGHAVAARGRGPVMGDQQQRGALLCPEIEEQLDDLLAGLVVEIAGGLVGQDDLRAPDARARAMATRCCSPPESWPG